MTTLMITYPKVDHFSIVFSPVLENQILFLHSLCTTFFLDMSLFAITFSTLKGGHSCCIFHYFVSFSVSQIPQVWPRPPRHLIFQYTSVHFFIIIINLIRLKYMFRFIIGWQLKLDNWLKTRKQRTWKQVSSHIQVL